MSRATNLIQFPHTSTGMSNTDTEQPVFTKPQYISQESAETRARPVAPMHIDEIYHTPLGTSTELNVALRLLSQSINHIDEALEALKNQDDVVADDAMQHVQAVLPELFNCRNLGDGYGAAINAVVCSIENLQGIPPNEKQIRAMRNIFSYIRSNPFSSVNLVAEKLSVMEDAELNIDPPGFEVLADWLDE